MFEGIGGHRGSLTSGDEMIPFKCIRVLMGTGFGSQKMSVKN